jgi:hypothetical protein
VIFVQFLNDFYKDKIKPYGNFIVFALQNFPIARPLGRTRREAGCAGKCLSAGADWVCAGWKAASAGGYSGSPVAVERHHFS